MTEVQLKFLDVRKMRAGIVVNFLCRVVILSNLTRFYCKEVEKNLGKNWEEIYENLKILAIDFRFKF